MLSRRQRRVLRYVQEGSLLKLKSYLRKHAELDINFSKGKRQKGVLHISCSLGDDAIMRVLLKHGADPMQKDRQGNTAAHTAANRALKHGKTAYDDLVVPLRELYPEAMSTANNAGVTPDDLLQWMRPDKGFQTGIRCEMRLEFVRSGRSHKANLAHVGDGKGLIFEPAEDSSCPKEMTTEREWHEKIFAECENDYFEMFGQDDYADNLAEDELENDFADWADRIRQEYYDKRSAEWQRLAGARSGHRGQQKSTQDREEEARKQKELLERLQQEHKEYLARAARKEEETRAGRKRRYEERCATTFAAGNAPAASPSDGSKLRYSDIPWPVPRGTVGEMLDVMLHGLDRNDVPAFRKALRRQQALWHPDKFSQRCGARLADGDRRKILDTVTALSQELNSLAQSLRG